MSIASLRTEPPDKNGLLTAFPQLWLNSGAAFNLSAGNGSKTVYGEFRTVAGLNGAKVVSLPSSATIDLNNVGPVVNLNSPAGILDPQSGPPLQLVQPQLLNSGNGQWITYSGWSTADPPETFTFSIKGCTPSSCSQLATGTDEAGNSTTTTPAASSGVFSLFSAAAGAATLTCNPPGGSQGTVLADQADNDIPGDDPSAFGTSCSTGDTIAFSGYADPSMRRDPLVTSSNLYGTNLWMLYSYPKYWSIASTCTNTGVVEVHQAENNVSATAIPGGTSWSAWCTGANCDTQTSATPIWHSEPYCGSAVNGQPCAAQCAIFTNYTCFSSHEVANFWPFVNGGTETWYAVHLMYYVKLAQGVSTAEIANGCLVMSVAANTPTALGWASGQGPTHCGTASLPVTFPSGNTPLYYTTLTNLAQTAPRWLSSLPCMSSMATPSTVLCRSNTDAKP